MLALVTVLAQPRKDDQVTAALEAVKAFANRAPEQAPVMHIHVPPVPPTPVHVDAPVVQNTTQVLPTPVHVEPPAVNVTNVVQPATVSVELPARQTDSLIERDPDGNIIKVTQTETTLQ